jgi:hypothetical protein
MLKLQILWRTKTSKLRVATLSHVESKLVERMNKIS